MTQDIEQRYDQLTKLRESSTDRQLLALVDSEIAKLKEELAAKDRNNARPVILEVRAGTGGEEAELFAAELIRMYLRYAEAKDWRREIIELNQTPLGGVKQAVVMLRGAGVYSALRWEGGVHRVQRIPKTEKSGRLHTSAASVVVMPEVGEAEVKVRPDELRIDVFRSSGHGGQGVNTTDSAVRLTHLPTGLVATCQDERSQLKNKEKALRVLRSRLKALEEEKALARQGKVRRAMIGSGDRSEKIRTYNFPQNRVTDHRLNESWHDVAKVIDGELDPLISKLGDAAFEASLADRPDVP